MTGGCLVSCVFSGFDVEGSEVLRLDGSCCLSAEATLLRASLGSFANVP